MFATVFCVCFDQTPMYYRWSYLSTVHQVEIFQLVLNSIKMFTWKNALDEFGIEGKVMMF